MVEKEKGGVGGEKKNTSLPTVLSTLHKSDEFFFLREAGQKPFFVLRGQHSSVINFAAAVSTHCRRGKGFKLALQRAEGRT